MLNVSKIRRLSLLGWTVLSVAQMLLLFFSRSSVPSRSSPLSFLFGNTGSGLMWGDRGGFFYIIALLSLIEIICVLVAAGCYFVDFLSERKTIDLFTSISLVFSFGGILTAIMFFLRARKVNSRIAFLGLIALGVSVLSIFVAGLFSYIMYEIGIYGGVVYFIIIFFINLITVVVPKAYFLLEDISEG